MRNQARLLILFVTLMFSVAGPAAVSARAADLDPTFGLSGRLTTAVAPVEPDWDSSGPGPARRPEAFASDVHVAAASDGSIVVARGNLLLRYLPDGGLDPNFGEGGRLTIQTVEGLPWGLADLAVDAEGRILLFGTTVVPSVSRFIDGYQIFELSPSFVTVLRLNVNGALDPTFGNGDGVFRSALGLRPTPGTPTDIPLVQAESGQIDSAGRAVLAIGKIGFPPSIRTTPGWVGAALIRLTPSGDLDHDFGGDGIVEVRKVVERAALSGFCLTRGGEAILELRSGSLARLRVDGSLDRAFGRRGIAPGSRGYGGPACDRSGHLFVLRGPKSYAPTSKDPSSWRVVRRSAGTGRVDRPFSRRAVLSLSGKSSLLTSLAIDPVGRVLVVGVSRPANGKGENSSHLTVFRLLPSGRLDQSFGNGGRSTIGFGRNVSIGATGAAVDAAGRLVVVAAAHAPWLQPDGVVVARYLAAQL